MLDKFYRKRYKILGGPGCGKTTKILQILSNYLKGGVNPDQVLMIGFAKATVETLKDRCVDQKLLDKEQVESITTIHKFCLDRIGKVNILKRTKSMLFVNCNLYIKKNMIASATGVWKVIKKI